MAGDWIKMRIDLMEDPAVMQMADKLGVREEVVVGYCHAFWSWVSRQIGDGMATGVSLVSLGRRLNLPGFPEMLVEVGWLEYTESDPDYGGNPVIRIPKFERHLSESAKKRAVKAKQKQAERVAKMSPPTADKMATREEKRREEKKPKKEKARAFDPLSLELPFTEEYFQRAWQTWVAHRREIRKPLTERSALQQLSRFEEWGPVRATAAIEYTVEKGWQGIREPEGNGQPRESEPISFEAPK